MSRNELCACGSGKRYKHCHGAIEAAMPAPAHAEAQAAHRAGSLRRAEALYRQAVARDPLDVEALHMLGVVLFERMRHREALDWLWQAAERSGWAVADIRHDLGLVLAKLLSVDANGRQELLVAAYLARERDRKAMAADRPRVSVVLPVYNQASVVAQAIASVAAQTHRDIELVVVDDGSTDRSAAVVADCLARVTFPATLVRRAHRGAALAANEGAELASGRYLALLSAEDCFAPDRIERMVAQIARPTPLWGFSRLAALGADGKPLQQLAAQPRHFRDDEPASFTLLNRDVTGASGNLFVERGLFRKLGGYRDLPRHRGWDFCVRAATLVEPVIVDEPLYLQRRLAADAPAHSATDRRARELVAAALAGALVGDGAGEVDDEVADEAAAINELSPQFPGNRDLLLRNELRAGHGDRIPVAVLRSAAAVWRARPPPAVPRKHMAVAQGRTQAKTRAQAQAQAGKTALVVLGVYRSGTSALARALNLCGASLPAQVVPARLGLNPKGFWESEAVNDLDARLLHNLGGDWNRVPSSLPREGPLLAEFLHDARELLAAECGDAPFILIKDPRVCVLAPLWQRALAEAGYRPVYVVPVRNPLEIARSFESRDDMPVAEGLALWLAYAQRVEAFAGDRESDVVHVRYVELLDDWRGVIGRIARRLDVPLAIDSRADEVDRFLEADLRKHQVADAALDAQLPGERGESVRALYRHLLKRCALDAAGQ